MEESLVNFDFIKRLLRYAQKSGTYEYTLNFKLERGFNIKSEIKIFNESLIEKSVPIFEQGGKS
jgi:hypothetical protein